MIGAAAGVVGTAKTEGGDVDARTVVAVELAVLFSMEVDSAPTADVGGAVAIGVGGVAVLFSANLCSSTTAKVRLAAGSKGGDVDAWTVIDVGLSVLFSTEVDSAPTADVGGAVAIGVGTTAKVGLAAWGVATNFSFRPESSHSRSLMRDCAAVNSSASISSCVTRS